ncbi:Serine/threonine exchanger SteT [Anatilimnocola aggregata]|uniref:Serine/threonine exchanger SteT n=1 Tax=Anatilimnocola aggregata TaxID=2528021 RepID=A0A517Y4W4_9BACT|nr:amino acid permease [Anatilimnocola aggregata]QDU25162.1 Serine/threonine exchanger SteT [Anatilimnocola aggregata]
MPATPERTEPALGNQPQRRLTLLDTTSIIVGIIIGSTIFKSSPLISASAAGWMTWALQQTLGWPGPDDTNGLMQAQYLGIALIWLIGGVIALLGALCYAELATALPHEGGNYVFLTTAFGRPTGFAFAWAEFWIVRPGNIGAIAFVMATFALQLLPDSWRTALGARGETILAVAAIALLTVINILGIQMERWTQNVLTAAKVLGLLFVALTAWCFLVPPVAISAPQPPNFLLPLGIIFVMFAYGGWSDMSYVAAEVANPQKNITRALLLGTTAVTVIYLLLNLGFVHGLGLAGVYESKSIASDVLHSAWGPIGDRAISLLVVVSCLGTIHGMLFTGARVFYKLGSEHWLFRWLGAWDAHRAVPLNSLLAQAVATIALVMIFGANAQAFDRLVVFTGPFYWGFICLVIIALAVLRQRGQLSADRYRVPLYPLPPILFVLACVYMCYAGIKYAWTEGTEEGYWSLGVVVVGAIVVAVDFVAGGKPRA